MQYLKNFVGRIPTNFKTAKYWNMNTNGFQIQPTLFNLQSCITIVSVLMVILITNKMLIIIHWYNTNITFFFISIIFNTVESVHKKQ